jgi:hypothetical protein
MWWLIVLTILVLYLLWKTYQIVAWLKKLYDAVLAQMKACGCPQDKTWPPPPPPDWP